MKFCQAVIISLLFIVALTLGVSSPASAAQSLILQAGTTAGWDFHDLDTDLVKNNTVDWDDLGVIASHWLNSGCGDPNQWCAGADIDGSTGVDFIDYALLSKDWTRQGANDVLLQTIYGTNQDANGTIIYPNSAHALSQGKECLMVFAVPQATALDKGWFKLVGIKASYSLRVRLYNVTGQNLLNRGITIPKSSLDTWTTLYDQTVPTGSSVPSHVEGAQNVTDLIVNFDSLQIPAGEYLISFINASGGFTIGSIVRGVGTSGEPDKMGTYGLGGPSLPKRATVTTTAAVGNTYFYYLSATTSVNYQGISNLLAFQITLANRPPVVNAGLDQTIQYPDLANLSGTASDDGFPDPPSAFTTTWSKTSGPGTVTFGDANALNTTATFSVVGTYVLRLTGNDGALSAYDEVTIIYTDNHAPAVDAGIDQTIGILDGANLNGTVTDDGLPNPPATVTTLWTKTSGPGTATFGNANNVDTSVSFSATGTYVLRLTADDSDMSAYDEVTIEVVAGSLNNAPVVDAGTDRTIDEGGTASLDGTVTDDGKPNPPAAFTVQWTKTSGPGTVTFGNANLVDTTAEFSAAGTYVLRLTADDSQLTNYDEMTVTVRPFGSYEGYGAAATGGAGGSVIWVTNLNASGSGSLQSAMSGTGARIIKFSVGGRIVVGSALSLNNGNVTIMGSTAPSPGITIDGDNVSYRALEVDGSNIIIENMRFRNCGGELVLVWGGDNIVFDHCSFTWNGDGALDLNGSDWGAGTNHITINRCLFGGAEELSRSHGHQITWMYNLFTTCNRRQPKIALGGPDYNLQCNYIRNWCNTATHIQGGNGHINVINNYYGPPYPTEVWTVACYSDTIDPNFIYTAGNAHAADIPTSPPRGSYNANNVGLATAPFVDETPPVAVTLIDANDVPASVLASVGAQPSDSHDLAYITGSYTGRDHTIGGEGP